MRILVVQPNGLGESIYSTPVVKTLIGENHAVSVGVANKSRLSGWILNLPGVNKVYNLSEVEEIRSALFDALVLCDGRKKNAGIHKQYGIERLLAPPWIDGPQAGDAKRGHVCDFYFRAVKPLGLTHRASVSLPATKPVSWPSKRTIGFCIGYLKTNKGAPAKHWGDKNYADLGIWLGSRNIDSVLVGDPLDFEANGKAIVQQSGGRVSSELCYIEESEKLASHMKNLAAVVGNSTGLMHLAAALCVPTIAVWKAGAPAPRWGPLGKNAMVIPSDKHSMARVQKWILGLGGLNGSI
jgi:ADP-heptose:LPS heptosyltransferase